MKKTIAFILALSMLCSLSITAFAEEGEEYLTYNGDTTTIDGEYDISEEFCIVIPQTLRLDRELTFYATNLNIEYFRQINVYCNTLANGGTIKLTKSAITNSYLEIGFNNVGEDGLVAIFLPDSMTSKAPNENAKPEPYVITENPKAGIYFGRVQFTIICDIAPEYRT